MDYFQSGPYTWVLGFLALAPRLGPAVRCSFPANAVTADRWSPAISSVEALTSPLHVPEQAHMENLDEGDPGVPRSPRTPACQTT